MCVSVCIAGGGGGRVGGPHGTAKGLLFRPQTGTRGRLRPESARGGRQKPTSVCLNPIFLPFILNVRNF